MATLDFETETGGLVPTTCEFSLMTNTQTFISPLTGEMQTVELPGARWATTLSFTDLEPDESRVLLAFLARLRGSAGRLYLHDYSLETNRGAGISATTDEVGSGIDGSVTTVNPTYFTSTSYTFTSGDVDRYVKITSGAQQGEYKILTFIDANNVTVNTTFTSIESSLTFEILEPKNKLSTDWGVGEASTVVVKAGDYIEVNGELKMVIADATTDGSGLATLEIEPPLRALVSTGQPITINNSKSTFLLVDDDQVKWGTRDTAFLSNISFSCVEAF